MQNRAVEGDEVALQVLPPSQWFISGSMVEKAKAKPSIVSTSPGSSSQPEDMDASSSSPALRASPLGSAGTPIAER